MNRFWLRLISICGILAGLCFGYLSGGTRIELLGILAVVCMLVGVVCSILASRCPYCGRIQRYGMWSNYCSHCGSSMDD